ncbi:hypothetical protein ST47_g3294 [Ascochyta rabiei]|uniref:Uncharacterized protein n=1 Tax=Didymella rabiei TaxID=5454 RepID=A0A163I404_DIDRA|nr:hypothetical protein ST47_g3294 [Ascochyta rabiei]
MDVRKWLAETEDPTLLERPVVEPFLLPRLSEAVPVTRRRRKRSLTDSSLLKAPLSQTRGKGIPAIERDRRHVQDVADRAYGDTSHSTRSEFASNSTASQRYTRKPRHKTRPNRYEIGTKKDKGPDDNPRPNRRSELRRSKRKCRRSIVENTHSGIRQEFQAKNVSRDRLTLKPLGTTGLFRKGKASTAAKGYGLPDLVFSEMRFLRNDRVENEHSAQGPDNKKKRKKDHAQTKEGDIFAFFTSVRPALADVASTQLTSGGRPRVNTSVTKNTRRRRAREQSTVLDPAVRTINPEDGASYLGFAGRGSDRETSRPFSWSESFCAPSTTPGHHKRTSAVHGEGLDPLYQKKKEGLHRHTSLWRQEISTGVHEPIDAATEVARASSEAPVRSRLSSLRSSLQRSSSSRRSISVDQDLHRRSTEDEPPLSSKPPVLPSTSNVDSLEHPVTGTLQSDGSIATPYAGGNAVLAPKQVLEDAARTLLYRPSPQGSRIPLIQFLAPDSQPLQPANLSGPSFYVQQEQRQHLIVPFELEEEYCVRDPDTVGRGYQGESESSIQEDVEGFSEGPMSYGKTEEMDDDGDVVAGLDYAADEVEQAQRPGHAAVVAAGFWRPNKLY